MASTNNPDATQETPAATPAQPVAPENLSMRYKYELLDAPHKAIADQVAALLIAYPDVVKLNDPEAQKKFEQDVANSGVGSALSGLGSAESVITDKVRNAGIPIISGALGAAKTANDTRHAVGDVIDGTGKGLDIALSPLSIPGAGLSTAFNEAKVIWNDMTPEKARDIGAHYASVLQAQQETRGADGLMGFISGFKSTDSEHPYMSGFTNGMSQMWDYIRAGVSWAFDHISSMVTGKPTQTFEQHLDQARFSTDIAAVRNNMATATDLPNANTFAHALTEGAEVQNRAGQNTKLAAPTADTVVATLPDAPKDKNNRVIVAPKDNAAVLSDAKHKAIEAAKDRAAVTYGGINTPGKIAGAALGTAAVADAALGVVHGVQRGPVKKAEVHATQLETQAEKLQKEVSGLEKRLAPDSNERKLYHGLAKAGDKVGGKVGDKLGANEAQWEAGLQEKLTVAREKAAEANHAAGEAREAAAHAREGLSAGAAKIHNGVNPETGKVSRVSKLVHAPHNVGRAVGERLSGPLGGAHRDVQTIVNGVKQIPHAGEHVPEQFHAGAASAQANRAAHELETAEAALKAAKEQAAAHADKAAGKGLFGFMRSAGTRASEAEQATHYHQLVTRLEGKVKTLTAHGVGKAMQHDLAALPEGMKPNLFHGIGRVWGNIQETAASWMGTGKTAARVADAAGATAHAAAATASVAKPGIFATGLVGASKLVGWVPRVGKPVAVALTGLAALVGGVELFTGKAEAAESGDKPKHENGFDATANLIDKGKATAAVVTTGATAASFAGMGGAGVATVASAPVALGVAAVGGTGYLLADQLRGLAREERAASISGTDAQKLIAMVRPGVKYDDAALDFISQLLKEREQRIAKGQTLDVTMTIDASRPAHEHLQRIENRMSEKDIGQLNALNGNNEAGVQAIRYANENIDAMLMKKAQYFLGDVSLKQAAAALDRSEAAGKLGILDSIRYNLLGDESVLQLPKHAVPVATASHTPKAQPLTNHEMVAGLDEVKHQARMAMSVGRTGENRGPAVLNLGIRAHSVVHGSNLTPGGSDGATPRLAAKQSGPVHANA